VVDFEPPNDCAPYQRRRTADYAYAPVTAK